jgi:hypothetical protein
MTTSMGDIGHVWCPSDKSLPVGWGFCGSTEGRKGTLMVVVDVIDNPTVREKFNKDLKRLYIRKSTHRQAKYIVVKRIFDVADGMFLISGKLGYWEELARSSELVAYATEQKPIGTDYHWTHLCCAKNPHRSFELRDDTFGPLQMVILALFAIGLTLLLSYLGLGDLS